MDSKICVICGIKQATTREHIPPKGLFSKPYPDNTQFITVPSCAECNNGTSGMDEEFRDHLSISVRVDTESQKSLWEKAQRGIERKKKPKTASLYVKEKGIIRKKKAAFWSKQNHDIVVNKIVKGLYFHCYREIAQPNVEIDIDWYGDSFPSAFKDLTPHTSLISVCGNQFVCRHSKLSGGVSSGSSVWMVQFYGRHSILATVR